MALTAIGPVTIAHGDPVFGSSASPTAHGIRSLTVSGSASWTATDTLEELVANQATRITRAGFTGVVEWLNFDDALMSNRTGDYILIEFSRDADQKSSMTADDVPFTLNAAGPLP